MTACDPGPRPPFRDMLAWMRERYPGKVILTAGVCSYDPRCGWYATAQQMTDLCTELPAFDLDGPWPACTAAVPDAPASC